MTYIPARTKSFIGLHEVLTPPWLRDEEEGAKVCLSLETMVEADVERSRLAVKLRMPELAPGDATSMLARDRKLIRGIGESDEAFATRMLTWLDDHKQRGGAFALMRQIRAYCQADVRVRTVDRRGNWYTIDRDGTESYLLDQDNWDWDGAAASPRWARFWVIIYPTAAGEPWDEGPAWGDPGLVWGSEGPDGPTWGTSATVREVEGCRRIVRDWKPAGTRCEHIIIAFDDASFAPDGSSGDLPDGTWWKAGNRLATARYWRGTRSV